MKKLMAKLEYVLELGGVKKDEIGRASCRERV